LGYAPLATLRSTWTLPGHIPKPTWLSD